MIKTVRIARVAATHLAAFALGWVIWDQIGPAGGRGSSADAGAPENRRERRTRGTDRISGDEALDRIAGEAPAADTFVFVDWQHWAENKRKEYDLLLAKAGELPVAADPAAAGKEALAALAAKNPDVDAVEMSARLVHWLRADPAAAIAHVKSLEDESTRFANRMHLANVGVAIAAEKGPAEVARWFRTDPEFDSVLRVQLARYLGASGDLTRIDSLKQNFDPQAWKDLRGRLAVSWPMDKAGALVELARAENSPALLTNFAMARGSAGATWLLALLDSGGLDPATAEAITSQPGFAQLMRQSPGIDLDTRAETVARFQPDQDTASITRELARRDVAVAIWKGRDYRYAFRSGAMTAAEIQAALAAELPELAAKSPDALRASLFQQLALENGPRALELLEGMPAEEKWRMAMEPLASGFQQENPAQLYDYLQRIPADGTPELREQRLDAWSKLGNQHYQRLGPDYITWVKGLPDGLDKDMAAYALVRTIGGADPDATLTLADGIQDRTIRQKLSENP